MFGFFNRLYFDEELARSKGYEGRITHGAMIVSAISKYFGTEFPGEGTIFLRYSYKFMKPIYPDRKYKVEISFPFIDYENGLYKSLVKIEDCPSYSGYEGGNNKGAQL